jgi:hypothetical protein
MNVRDQLQALGACPHPTTLTTEQEVKWAPRTGLDTGVNKIRILSLAESASQLCSPYPISLLTELQCLWYKGISNKSKSMVQ